MPAPSTTRSTRRSDTRPARKPSRTASTRTRRRATATRQAPPSPAAGLPGWADLGAKPSGSRKHGGARGAPSGWGRRARFLDVAPSLRFGVWTLLACIAVTLYVGHVYATQATLAELQRAERENLRLVLTHERLQGAYDRMTGPQTVMTRARELGLEEGIAYGPVIGLND